MDGPDSGGSGRRTRAARAVRGRWRPAAGWLGVVAGAAFFGGTVPAVAAVVLGAWHLVRAPRPAVVVGLSIALLAVVPALWLIGNVDRLGSASPLVVLGNRAPATVAAVALLLLVVGVHRDTRRPAGGVRS